MKVDQLESERSPNLHCSIHILAAKRRAAATAFKSSCAQEATAAREAAAEEEKKSVWRLEIQLHRASSFQGRQRPKNDGKVQREKMSPSLNVWPDGLLLRGGDRCGPCDQFHGFDCRLFSYAVRYSGVGHSFHISANGSQILGQKYLWMG